jgi:hypothetical protein
MKNDLFQEWKQKKLIKYGKVNKVKQSKQIQINFPCVSLI